MKHITPAEQARLDREKLARFVRNIKHYKTVWGCPPDRIAFRYAWMSAKSNVNTQESAS